MFVLMVLCKLCNIGFYLHVQHFHNKLRMRSPLDVSYCTVTNVVKSKAMCLFDKHFGFRIT